MYVKETIKTQEALDDVVYGFEKLRKEKDRKKGLSMKRWRKEQKEYILKSINPPKEEVKLTKDHIIPKSFIRALNKDNIQMITKAENIAKGNKLTKEALEKILKVIIEHL